MRVHENRTQTYLREGFVLSEDSHFEELGGGLIVLEGAMECTGGILLEIEKLLTVDGEGPSAMVQTIVYRYHARLPGRANIFRYDSPHDTHNRFHHVHRYDTFGSGAEVCVEKVEGEDAIPTLSDVLDELRNWYYANYNQIERGRQAT